MDDARRHFLKTIAISGVAASPLLTRHGVPAAEAVVAPKCQEDRTGEPAGNMPARRKAVLIASAEGSLKQTIVSHLDRTYQLRFARPRPFERFLRIANSQTRTRTLFRRLDAIVYVPGPSGQSGMPDRIDDYTRVTYDLLQAAVQEGVRHLIYLSSLEMMVGHGEAFQVDEDWPPIPGDSLGPLDQVPRPGDLPGSYADARRVCAGISVLQPPGPSGVESGGGRGAVRRLLVRRR